MRETFYKECSTFSSHNFTIGSTVLFLLVIRHTQATERGRDFIVFFYEHEFRKSYYYDPCKKNVISVNILLLYFFVYDFVRRLLAFLKWDLIFLYIYLLRNDLICAYIVPMGVVVVMSQLSRWFDSFLIYGNDIFCCSIFYLAKYFWIFSERNKFFHLDTDDLSFPSRFVRIQCILKSLNSFKIFSNSIKTSFIVGRLSTFSSVQRYANSIKNMYISTCTSA